MAARLIAHEQPRLGHGDFGGQTVNGNGDIPLTMVLSTDYSDSERIFNVRTGAEVSPQLPAYGFIAVASWTSEETAYVVGLARGRVDLLACDLASGTCSVEAEDIGRGFQVPHRRADLSSGAEVPDGRPVRKPRMGGAQLTDGRGRSWCGTAGRRFALRAGLPARG